MEREASFLRCSKLSCYAEFNRMVQAIARQKSLSGGFSELQGTGRMTGSSAEYQFYYSLAMMLRQTISNFDQVSQKEDLKRVYNWYCLNKPLIRAKTKRSQRKPVLYLKTTGDKQEPNRERVELLNRPQTAPASLCHSDASLGVKVSTGYKDREKLKGAFTSSYISRSMSRELDLAGRPFDQLQSTHAQDHIRPLSSQKNKTPPKSQSRNGTKSPLSIVEFPFQDMFDHSRPATVPGSVSCEQLFHLTSGVAAQMTIDNELRSMQEQFVRRTMSAQPATRPSPRQLVTSPVNNVRPKTTKESSTSSQKWYKEDKKDQSDPRQPQTSPENIQAEVSTQHTPSELILKTGNRELASPPLQEKPAATPGNSFVLKGRAMKAPRYEHTNMTRQPGMEVIPEEELSSHSLTRDSSSRPTSSKGANKTAQPHESRSGHMRLKDGSPKNLSENGHTKSFVKFSENALKQPSVAGVSSSMHTNEKMVDQQLPPCNPQNNDNDAEGPDKMNKSLAVEADKDTDMNDTESTSLSEMPVSPKVTVSRRVHGTKSQNETPGNDQKRLTTAVKVTTFSFVQDDSKFARSHSSKNTRPPYKNRSRPPRPKSVHSQQGKVY